MWSGASRGACDQKQFFDFRSYFPQRNPWNEKHNLHHLSHIVGDILFDSYILWIVYDCILCGGAGYRWINRFNCLQHSAFSGHRQSLHYVSFIHCIRTKRKIQSPPVLLAIADFLIDLPPNSLINYCIRYIKHPHVYYINTYLMNMTGINNFIDIHHFRRNFTNITIKCVHMCHLNRFAYKWNCFVQLSMVAVCCQHPFCRLSLNC